MRDDFARPEFWKMLSNEASSRFLSADRATEIEPEQLRDDAVIGYSCRCGGSVFRLASTGKYELSAQCAGCGWMGVVYDG